MLRRLNQSILAFCVLSVLLHASTVAMLHVFQFEAPLRPPGAERQIEVTVIEKTSPPAAPPEKARQIVEQDEKSLNEDVPDDEYFLSRNNQKVKRQTKARQRGAFKNSAQRGAGTVTPGAPAKPKSPRRTSAYLDNDSDDPFRALRPSMDLSQMIRGSGPAGGGSQNDDHLEKVVEGMETVLNTREFLYYGYYSRIKAKIRQHWEPIIKSKITRLLKQGRHVASTQSRVTQIIILLDEGGELIKVQVVGASGIEDLDQAAVEAFRAAAPFPNPPRGMIEEDGKIRIRWDFILEA